MIGVVVVETTVVDVAIMMVGMAVAVEVTIAN